MLSANRELYMGRTNVLLPHLPLRYLQMSSSRLLIFQTFASQNEVELWHMLPMTTTRNLLWKATPHNPIWADVTWEGQVKVTQIPNTYNYPKGLHSGHCCVDIHWLWIRSPMCWIQSHHLLAPCMPCVTVKGQRHAGSNLSKLSNITSPVTDCLDESYLFA